MKKILNSKIFYFILGSIIFGGIGVAGAYTLLASDTGYTPRDINWEVNNTQDAIDDLYDRATSNLITSMTSVELQRTNNYIAAGTTYTITNINSYKYYYVIDTYVGGGCTTPASCNNIGNLTFTNATALELGYAYRTGNTRVTGKGYILFPKHNNGNITVTVVSGSDGVAIYGIK